MLYNFVFRHHSSLLQLTPALLKIMAMVRELVGLDAGRIQMLLG